MKHSFLKQFAFLCLTTLLFASCSTNEVEDVTGAVLSISQVTDLEANFDVVTSSGALKARFYSTSVSAENYIWSFPGGTPNTATSADSPTIVYEEGGEHTVTLEVENGIQTDTYSTTISF